MLTPLFIAIVSISVNLKSNSLTKSYILLFTISRALFLYLFKIVKQFLVLKPILDNSNTILLVL